VVSVWLCEDALAADCEGTWGNCVTCRDGCTRVLDNGPAPLGQPTYGYFQSTDCGALGMTYNVRNCTFFCTCKGTIIGTWPCNSQAVTAFITCGV
jgi:hypothetical protein